MMARQFQLLFGYKSSCCYPSARIIGGRGTPPRPHHFNTCTNFISKPHLHRPTATTGWRAPAPGPTATAQPLSLARHRRRPTWRAPDNVRCHCCCSHDGRPWPPPASIFVVSSQLDAATAPALVVIHAGVTWSAPSGSQGQSPALLSNSEQHPSPRARPHNCSFAVCISAGTMLLAPGLGAEGWSQSDPQNGCIMHWYLDQDCVVPIIFSQIIVLQSIFAVSTTWRPGALQSQPRPQCPPHCCLVDENRSYPSSPPSCWKPGVINREPSPAGPPPPTSGCWLLHDSDRRTSVSPSPTPRRHRRQLLQNHSAALATCSLQLSCC